MKAERRTTRYFNLDAREGWLVKARLRPIYPRERQAVPTVQADGWTPRQFCTLAENLTITGIRSPDRPDRSESLFRLSCPSPQRSRLKGSPYRTLA